MENEFRKRSYSISWHPGLSCVPATAKGTDLVFVRRRKGRTSELIVSFGKICTTLWFVWYSRNGMGMMCCLLVSSHTMYNGCNLSKLFTMYTSMTKTVIQCLNLTSLRSWLEVVWISCKSIKSAQARILWVKPSWGNSAVTRWSLAESISGEFGLQEAAAVLDGLLTGVTEWDKPL